MKRQKEIYARLEKKDFAATNLVLGIGSFTYQCVTRDNLGLAMKELADIRSATRGAIGYEDETHIEAMVVAHDEAVAKLKEYLVQFDKYMYDISCQSFIC